MSCNPTRAVPTGRVAFLEASQAIIAWLRSFSPYYGTKSGKSFRDKDPQRLSTNSVPDQRYNRGRLRPGCHASPSSQILTPGSLPSLRSMNNLKAIAVGILEEYGVVILAVF